MTDQTNENLRRLICGKVYQETPKKKKVRHEKRERDGKIKKVAQQFTCGKDKEEQYWKEGPPETLDHNSLKHPRYSIGSKDVTRLKEYRRTYLYTTFTIHMVRP